MQFLGKEIIHKKTQSVCPIFLLTAEYLKMGIKGKKEAELFLTEK